MGISVFFFVLLEPLGASARLFFCSFSVVRAHGDWDGLRTKFRIVFLRSPDFVDWVDGVRADEGE